MHYDTGRLWETTVTTWRPNNLNVLLANTSQVKNKCGARAMQEQCQCSTSAVCKCSICRIVYTSIMTPFTTGSSQNQQQQFRLIRSSIQLLQINIEGISKPKSQYLSKICMENKIDIIIIQETYTADENQIMLRGRIPGYDLLGGTYNKAYGVATYVRNTVENAM